MANAVSIFDPDQVPAHVTAFLEENSNIPASDSVSTLSIKGKVFTVVIGGEATKIMKTNAEGEEEPVSVFPVVILASQERRGREYYEGAYNPEATAPPVCWSNDGLEPDATVLHKKSSKCSTCPLAIKGSKQTDNGKDAVACQEFRLLAIVPAHDLEFEPLRLKLRVTSDWDGKNKEAQAKHWYGYKNYTDLLRAKGYKDTRVLSTKLRFDTSAEYPKVQFSPGKWLTPEALERAKEISETPAVKALITASYTARSDEDKPVKPGAELPQSDEEDEGEVTLSKPKAEQVAPAAKEAAVVEIEEDEDDKAIRLAQEKKAAKEAAVKEALKQKAIAEAKAQQEADAKAKAASKKAAVAEVDEDDEDAVIAAAIARKKAKEAAAKAPAEKTAASKPKAVPEDEDTPPAVKAPKADGKPKTAPVSAAVAGVLGKWADDD